VTEPHTTFRLFTRKTSSRPRRETIEVPRAYEERAIRNFSLFGERGGSVSESGQASIRSPGEIVARARHRASGAFPQSEY